MPRRNTPRPRKRKVYGAMYCIECHAEARKTSKGSTVIPHKASCPEAGRR